MAPLSVRMSTWYFVQMKVDRNTVTVAGLHDSTDDAYWQSRTPEERIAGSFSFVSIAAQRLETFRQLLLTDLATRYAHHEVV